MTVRRDLMVLVAVLALVGGLLVLAPPPVEAQVSGPTPLKVVLIGDSYSAGNGARPYHGPKGCYRSHENWSSQHVRWLRTQGYAVTLVNRACSGAVTANLLNDRRMDEVYVPAGMPTAAEAIAYGETVCTSRYPDEEYYTVAAVPGSIGIGYDAECTRYLKAQVEAVGADTDLVLFTAGGNDVSFASIVQQCFAVGFRDPGDCRDNVENAAELLDTVQADLGRVFSRLRARMRPDARVALLSYPYLSTDVDYVLKSRFGLPGHDSYAAAAEVRALGRLGDTRQRAAVTAFNRSVGTDVVTYVDGVKAHFGGHEPDPRASSRNPQRWLNEFETRIAAEWYHYNPTGHEQIDRLLRTVDLIGSTRTPTDGGDIDIVLVVDTTGSMGGYIDAVKAFATDFIAQVDARTTSARFALVTYQDHPSHTGNPADYPSRVEIGFSADAAAVTAAVNGMQLGDGGDYPESAYSGIMTGLGLPWRPGVKKIVIQLGDAPAHDPEPVTGYTAADVIRTAFEVDPAEVYVVDGGLAGPGLTAVAAGTNGAVIPSGSPSQVSAAMLAAIDAALDKPYAWAGGPYTAFTGTPVTFDASGSFDPGGVIVSYEWDVDGDGTYEATTTEPFHTHTYTADFDGFMGVRVTSDRGTSSLGSVRSHASIDADEVPADEDNCPEDHNPGQEDVDGDGIGDACDEDSGFPTEDREGVIESTSGDAAIGYTRLFGTDRFATAVAVSQAGWESSGVAVVATGRTYPDALAGGALTAALDAPLLLTQPDGLPANVAAELVRLGATRIHVLGGSAAVSDAVLEQLRALPTTPEVSRLAGRDRFATAATIAEAVGADGDLVTFASGHNFPDALSSGALLATDAAPPVLLVHPDGVPGVARDTAARLEPAAAFVVGGTAAVDQRTFAALRDVVPGTARLSGPDRFATSAAVAAEALDRLGDDGRPLVIATGNDFADALVAGSVAAQHEAPLLVVPGSAYVDTVEAFLAEHRERFSEVIVIGGTGAVSDEVVGAVMATLAGPL